MPLAFPAELETIVPFEVDAQIWLGCLVRIQCQVNNSTRLFSSPCVRIVVTSSDNYPDKLRDQAIDTSPSAHVLVIARESGEGISVYKYDPQKQTLTKVWEGNACTIFC
jgi:hypothetical protein